MRQSPLASLPRWRLHCDTLGRMKSCAQCKQQNQEDAKFCYQCGNTLAVEPEALLAAPVIHTDENLWRQFIGPHADRYLKHFKKIGLGEESKFVVTWNWPAFLFISFVCEAGRDIEGIRRGPALRDLGRHRLLCAVHYDHDQNAAGWANRRRKVAREAGKTDCSEQCVNQNLSRWL